VFRGHVEETLMYPLNRRQLLRSTVAAAALPVLPAFGSAPAMSGTKLRIDYREIVVRGRSKKVFGITQPNGKHGIVLGSRDRFRVELTNAVDDSLLIHWHGQEPPASQDGVPELSQYPLPPRTLQFYDFEPRPGTHWMHSHLGFQEQDLMSAPLIVRTADDERADMQEVVILLHDFTFAQPDTLLADLGGLGGESHGYNHHAHAAPAPAAPSNPHAGMPGMAPAPTSSPASNPHANMPGMPGMGATPAPAAGGDMAGMAMDLNDINFDAYLANDRTLDDPETVRVERDGRVRLRIINAAAATNFFIDLGALDGRAVAVDGNPIRPMPGRRFPLAIAQRIDILLDLPRGEGAWPVLAQREGEMELTGIVLATARGTVARLSGTANTAAGPLSGHDFESKLVPLSPLAVRRPDRSVQVKLTGTMSPYAWNMSAHASGENLPVEVRCGERVQIVMRNETKMPHPMHLHGHHFQVTAFEKHGQKTEIRGAIRDTVLVPPAETVTIEFDAVNPGRWAFHCHTLYHQATGMMSEVRYAV
jgi:FtsP/CotA-like multicopper oxidase with cupredoxin domain